MRVLAKLTQRLRAGDTPAEHLYAAAVAQARREEFYLYQGVADTVRGRFELICVHVFLLFRRLKACGQPGRARAQELHDLMFADMDRSLREMGIGDMSIGKKVKQLATNLYGRIQAYDGSLRAEESLTEALRRNLYSDSQPSAEQVASLGSYIRREAEHLASQDCAELLTGRAAFGQPPVGARE